MKKQRSFEEKFDRKARVAQRHDFQERKQREFLTKYIVDEEESDFDIKRAVKGKYQKQG